MAVYNHTFNLNRDEGLRLRNCLSVGLSTAMRNRIICNIYFKRIELYTNKSCNNHATLPDDTYQTTRCCNTHQRAVKKFLLDQNVTVITLKLNTVHTAMYRYGNSLVRKWLISG